MAQNGIGATFADAHLLDGVRTPFADYNGALANASRAAGAHLPGSPCVPLTASPL